MSAPTALNAAFAAGDTSSIVAETLKAEGVARILDIGCGRGGLARALTARSFTVIGVDPCEAALEAARSAAPDATFVRGVAEALPIEASACDGAVFLNSLHHVPAAQMRAALREAVRVVGSGGPVVIVEPLPEGTFNTLLKIVDDETEVRNTAARAVADAVRDGVLELRGNVVYERRERFADVAALIDRLCSADPDRRPVAEENRRELGRLFEEHSVLEGGARVLSQPLRIYLLRTPDRSP